MSSCNGNCSSCGSDCGDRKAESLLAQLNPKASVKKVIAVVSGKGGVGKSTVTSMLAVAMARKGKRVGVLDADITGPSIPKAFGLTRKAAANDLGILPEETAMGIKVMSVNLLLEDESQPVVWRGPVVSGAVTQFWTDVVWGELDVLLIDMPPGTGDIPLTVYQSIGPDANLIVTTPQSLVQMVVGKAQRMAAMLDIPVLGFVENMSYVKCPDCGRELPLFGDGQALKAAAEEWHLPVLARLPMDASVAALCDSGEIERVVCDELAGAVDAVEALLR